MSEKVACLREEGEGGSRRLRLGHPGFYEECGCGDDLCQSFCTAEPPDGAYGPGHRCVPLLPPRGDLILDVVDGRIMYVEVLHYPELPRPAS